MTILATGGAGYIGSHLVKNLLRDDLEVVALDNLSTGHLEPIKILKEKVGDFDFIQVDLKDKEKLSEIFSKNKIEAVIHMAAMTDVRESVEKPDLYYQENYLNGINLIESMLAEGCQKIIFSSTSAVYGDPKYLPIDEKHPTNPVSPYGQTKLDFENYLSTVKNLEFVIFRYFNVAGSDPEGLIGKANITKTDLTENIMKVALGQREVLEIFGGDYDTPDGTPIRDLLHVEDVAQAHILALKNISKYSGEIFNLGSEKGFSVKEIIEKAEEVIGKKIPAKVIDRKEGDPTKTLASSKKAKELLSWKPEYSTLEAIFETDYNWRRKHPLGYAK